MFVLSLLVPIVWEGFHWQREPCVFPLNSGWGLGGFGMAVGAATTQTSFRTLEKDFGVRILWVVHMF